MASYFASYFQASSMKPLLRYALSRLDILDTDALDLDSLDFTVGRTSTFEFRDIGLRLKQLETLLQLPPTFEVNKARVLLLRVTIPIDIYRSPIVVEVDGIEGQLRVKSKAERSQHINHERKRKSSRKGDLAGTDSRSHAGRGSDYPSDDNEPAIPTANDLAQSFLQMESEEEKAKLEAAMTAGTQESGMESSLMSDDGEVVAGTGVPLEFGGLGGYFTGFLHGIVDRLQVRVRGIIVNLELDITNDTPRPMLNATDPVTIQLKIDDVDIEGVTSDLEVVAAFDKDKQARHKDGKRLISLSKIRGALISEATLFSGLSRSEAMSSPQAARSDTSEGFKSMRRSISTRESGSQKLENASDDRESTASSMGLSTPSLPQNLSDTRPLVASVIASESGRFEDASEEDSNMSESLRESMSDSMFQNSAYLDQVGDSQFLDEEENQRSSIIQRSQDPRRSGSLHSTPKASVLFQRSEEEDSRRFDNVSTIGSRRASMVHSTVLPKRPRSRFFEGRVSQSQPTLPPDLGTKTPREAEFPQAEPLTDGNDTGSDGDVDDAVTPIPEEDLTQSQLFSHEDAESMYMSAVSHTSAGPMPSCWSSSHTGISDDHSLAPSGRVLPHIQASTDNLVHARQHSPEKSIFDRDPLGQSYVRNSATSSSQPSFAAQQHPNPGISHVSSGLSEHSITSSDEYTKLTKHILTLDRVDIYIPALNKGTPENHTDVPSSLSHSTFDGQDDVPHPTSQNVPGAFSQHLPRKQAPSPNFATPHYLQKPEASSKPKDAEVEVVVGQLQTYFDISVGRLIFIIFRQLQEALDLKTSSSSKTKPEVPSSSPSSDTKFTLDVEKIALHFVERLEGTLGASHTFMENARLKAPSESEVLLCASLNGLSVESTSSSCGSSTRISVKKFNFGYALESIVSFDADLQMHASTKDLKADEGVDIRVDIMEANDITRCEIVTLPLHVSIDLQRLDETFSWFGGLSSMLNLGSSIASNATITAAIPAKPKSRGVRFDTPAEADRKLQAPQSKMGLRIGGIILDLIGSECSVGVETSAVKVAYRDSGLGVFVHAMRLSGPHLKHSNAEPAITANITGSRLEFAPTPADADLDRLLALITPSNARYENDDDIMLAPLLRQRKQGSVLRLTIGDFQVRMAKLDQFAYLPELGEEVSRLGTVAKYLPEDDRPGLLSLISIKKFAANIDCENDIGTIQISSTGNEVAQITFPSLVALSVDTVAVMRNVSEELVGPATDPELREPRGRAPAIMARKIGDEMEPIVRVKLWNLRVEYRVPTFMALLGIMEGATSKEVSESVVASVATLTDFARPKPSKPARALSASSTPNSKPLAINVVVRDCIVGLNPVGLPSKLLVVLTEASLNVDLPKDQKSSTSLDLKKASLLIIDNVAHIHSRDMDSQPRRQSSDASINNQVDDLCSTGFVSVSYISAANALVAVSIDGDGDQCVDVQLRDDLFVLESCADSTQTLGAIFGALAPPTVPSKETKYRTKIVPVNDMLASLSGDAFGTAEGTYNFEEDFDLDAFEDEAGEDDEIDIDPQFYKQEPHDHFDEDIMAELGVPTSSGKLISQDTDEGVLLGSFMEPRKVEVEEELMFEDNYFGAGSAQESATRRWNSVKDTYERSIVTKKKNPLKVRVRDVHIIWNLFDGYDWQATRDAITQAVQNVESKAIESRAKKEARSQFEEDLEEDDGGKVIQDFLFNSIYVGIPANRDPRELAAAINQNLNDNATETESIATTTVSSTTSRPSNSRRSKTKKLRLGRSKHHKITFELRGVNVDMVTFPPNSGEDQNSIEINVKDLEVYDHIPTSAWKTFASYMDEAGEREKGSSMVNIQITNTRPVRDLPATEVVLTAQVLPLRLHVDQDALDFITRFFEFKDDTAPARTSPPGDIPFIQKAEVFDIPVKLDFKPKRVDYAGLRSGRTTEMMNFLILEEANMVLKHVIIRGCKGFDRVGKCLNDVWMPEIKQNQLPGILTGLAGVRSLANIVDGGQQLFTISYSEYKKNGRIVPALRQGVGAFGKTAGVEAIKMGAKAAIGVQAVLQSAEGFLSPTLEKSNYTGDDDESDEEQKHISLYANQPIGVRQGFKGAYTGLQHDLRTAKDAIIAMPGEAMDSGTAVGALKAVGRHAPTVILRPAIGVAKASGQILMGATNSLAPDNLRRADAKYKKH